MGEGETDLSDMSGTFLMYTTIPSGQAHVWPISHLPRSFETCFLPFSIFSSSTTRASSFS